MSIVRHILVTGATGQQGGAVARALVSRGHRVRALTRRPDSDKARQLAASGIEVVAGDLDDRASVVRAAGGVDTMYLMGNSYEAGIEAETRQGIAAADAAKEAGIGHLIYGSVSDADRKTGIPHFESKYLVEKHIAGLGIPHTISAPAAFMDNTLAPWVLAGLKQGSYAAALPPSRVLQQIAIDDIGQFVAALAERREQVFGKRFDIAGDALSGEEQAKILTEATGRSIRFQQLPVSVLRQQSEDLALMFEWFERTGYSADIAALRRDFPDVAWHSYAQWAKGVDWSVLDKD